METQYDAALSIEVNRFDLNILWTDLNLCFFRLILLFIKQLGKETTETPQKFSTKFLLEPSVELDGTLV